MSFSPCVLVADILYTSFEMCGLFDLWNKVDSFCIWAYIICYFLIFLFFVWFWLWMFLSVVAITFNGGRSNFWGGCKTHQSTRDHEIWYVYRSSEDQQLLIRQFFLRQTKNTNMAGSWNLKFTFCFMKTTHEPLNVDKWSLKLWKIMDIPTSFIWIIIFFGGVFEYNDGGIFKLLRWIQKLHQ
jgi:hypothetical protein